MEDIMSQVCVCVCLSLSLSYCIASAKPSVRCGTTRVGVLGTILSSSSKKGCWQQTGTFRLADPQKLNNMVKVHNTHLLPYCLFQESAEVHVLTMVCAAERPVSDSHTDTITVRVLLSSPLIFPCNDFTIHYWSVLLISLCWLALWFQVALYNTK